MTRKEMQERTYAREKAIASMRNEGALLREIGARYGISIERVRQLLWNAAWRERDSQRRIKMRSEIEKLRD